jgi:hypothetical protein
MSCAFLLWSDFRWGSPLVRCQCKIHQGKIHGQADVQVSVFKHFVSCSVAQLRWLGSILSRRIVPHQSAMPIQNVCVPLQLLAAQEQTQHEYMRACIVVWCLMIDAPSVTSQIVSRWKCHSATHATIACVVAMAKPHMQLTDRTIIMNLDESQHIQRSQHAAAVWSTALES